MPRFAEEPGTLFSQSVSPRSKAPKLDISMSSKSSLNTSASISACGSGLSTFDGPGCCLSRIWWKGRWRNNPPKKQEIEHFFTIHLFKQPEIPNWMKNYRDYRQTCWTLKLSMWFWPKGICPMILCKGCSFLEGRLRFVCSWTSRLLL